MPLFIKIYTTVWKLPVIFSICEEKLNISVLLFIGFLNKRIKAKRQDLEAKTWHFPNKMTEKPSSFNLSEKGSDTNYSEYWHWKINKICCPKKC